VTVIYDTYYPNIQAGKINLQAVNFSAFVVDATYVPDVAHRKSQVTGKIETLVKVLVGGDISTLTMSQIIDKVTGKLQEDELKLAAGFVVYDIATQELCFYEPFENLMPDGGL